VQVKTDALTNELAPSAFFAKNSTSTTLGEKPATDLMIFEMCQHVLVKLPISKLHDYTFVLHELISSVQMDRWLKRLTNIHKSSL
jgi:hypothetical protein